jgi:hypothetical protein
MSGADEHLGVAVDSEAQDVLKPRNSNHVIWYCRMAFDQDQGIIEQGPVLPDLFTF